MTTTSTVVTRELFLPQDVKATLRERGVDDNLPASDQVAAIVRRYAAGEELPMPDPLRANEARLERQVRTRFQIDEDIWRRAKKRAVREQTTVQAVVRAVATQLAS